MGWALLYISPICARAFENEADFETRRRAGRGHRHVARSMMRCKKKPGKFFLSSAGQTNDHVMTGRKSEHNGALHDHQLTSKGLAISIYVVT